MRFLIVDEAGASQQALAHSLLANNAVVDQIERGDDAIELARHYDYDVVLTNLVLPDMDAYDLVRRMRAARINTPVIIQADHARPQARVKAFAIGADDFITKPCDPIELFARMRAIVRRSKGYSQPLLRCGAVQLNLDSREVLVAGRSVHLTAKEYAILELLVLRKGMVLTKEVFLNHLYGGIDEPEMKIIDVFICKLRRKLADAGAPGVVGTIWGRGYVVRDASSHSTLAPAPIPSSVPVQDLVSA